MCCAIEDDGQSTRSNLSNSKILPLTFQYRVRIVERVKYILNGDAALLNLISRMIAEFDLHHHYKKSIL